MNETLIWLFGYLVGTVITALLAIIFMLKMLIKAGEIINESDSHQD